MTLDTSCQQPSKNQGGGILIVKIGRGMDEVIAEDDETGFIVSNLGRVFSKYGNELRGFVNGNGYRLVDWKDDDNIRHKIRVHRLVARNFIPNPNGLPFVNHKDENPSNNRVDNLEWCDVQYNNTYGTVIERHKETLKKNGICKECSLEKDGVVYTAKSRAEMALKTGLTHSAVSSICTGKIINCHGFHLIGNHSSNKTSVKKAITLTNGIEIKTFQTYRSAADYIKTSNGNVSGLANGTYKSIKGWHLLNTNTARCKYIKNRSRIITLTNGKQEITFDRCTDAALYIGSSCGNVSKVVFGKRKRCKGWMLKSSVLRDIENVVEVKK